MPWCSAPARSHDGGWLWGGRSPFQPCTARKPEHIFQNHDGEQLPECSRAGGELGTGVPGSVSCQTPWHEGHGAGGVSMGLEVPGWGGGCWDRKAKEGMGAALFPSRKNLCCVRGAGSITTAMRVPMSPRAALQRPSRCPGTAGVVVQGARVGLWPQCWLLIYHGEEQSAVWEHSAGSCSSGAAISSHHRHTTRGCCAGSCCCCACCCPAQGRRSCRRLSASWTPHQSLMGEHGHASTPKLAWHCGTGSRFPEKSPAQKNPRTCLGNALTEHPRDTT